MRALLCLLLATRLLAAEGDESKALKLQQLYDTAFTHYREGDYAKALQGWQDILRLDPDQKTARDLIKEAREEIRRRNKDRLDVVYTGLQAGDYKKALGALDALFETDAHNPRYEALRGALDEVSRIVPKVPEKSKAWRLASGAVYEVLGPKENARDAYNRLRYAKELAPGDKSLARLLDWLLARKPELALTDTVTPGMGLLEYKRYIALNHIYDGKYHLAVDVLDEVLALEPDDLISLKRLGSAYFSLGRAQNARDAWRKALALAPDDEQLKKFVAKLDAASPAKEASVPKKARRGARKKPAR